MKIGIGLPNQIRDVNPAIIPQWAVRAEDAGFSTLATVGRTAYPGVMDTVALAGAAAVTRSIALSSNVMLTTVWPGALLAKELAGIDGMSGGRLTLGVGIGGDRPDDFVVREWLLHQVFFHQGIVVFDNGLDDVVRLAQPIEGGAG